MPHNKAHIQKTTILRKSLSSKKHIPESPKRRKHTEARNLTSAVISLCNILPPPGVKEKIPVTETVYYDGEIGLDSSYPLSANLPINTNIFWKLYVDGISDKRDIGVDFDSNVIPHLAYKLWFAGSIGVPDKSLINIDMDYMNRSCYPLGCQLNSSTFFAVTNAGYSTLKVYASESISKYCYPSSPGTVSRLKIKIWKDA